MGSFTDALASTPKPRLGAPSKLDVIRDAMTDDDRAAFDAALANPAVSPSAIHRALRALGHDLNPTTVQKWATKARAA